MSKMINYQHSLIYIYVFLRKNYLILGETDLLTAWVLFFLALYLFSSLNEHLPLRSLVIDSAPNLSIKSSKVIMLLPVLTR